MASPYRTVNLPSESQVIVTNASPGPSKFWVRLVNLEAGYQKLRSVLDQTKKDDLKLLSSSPKSGTACIAMISDKLHRGLVLSTDCDLETSIVRLVDTGCEETVPDSSLFETSHKFMYYAQCSTCVSLDDGEALSSKPHMNLIFAKLMSNTDFSLNCKVVAKEPTHHTIRLSDGIQDLAEFLLELYNDSTLISELLESSAEIEIQTEPDAARRNVTVSTHEKVDRSPYSPKKEESEELTRFTVQIDKMKKEQEDLIQQKQQLEREVAQKEAEIEIRNEEVRNLRAEFDSLTTTLEQLKVQKKEEQNKLDDLASLKVTIEKEKESLIQWNNQVESDLSQLKKDIEKCSEEVRNLRAEFDSSTAIFKQVEVEKEEEQKKLDSLVSQKVIMEKRRESVIQQKKQLESDLAHLKEEIEKCGNEDRKLRVEFESLTTTFEKSQVEKKEEEKKHNDLASKKEGVEKERQSLIQQNNQLESDLAELKDDMEKCSQEVRNLRAEFDSSTATLEKLQIEKKEEEMRHKDLVSKKATMEKERESMAHQNNQMESDLALMKDELEIRREEHRKLRAEVDSFTAARIQLEIQVKESQKTLDDLASRDRDMNFPAEVSENLLRTLNAAVLDKAHSPDSEEEEEEALSVESIDNLKPQLAEGEFTSDITEPVNVDVLDEETPSGLEVQAAELVDDHPTPFQSVEKPKDSILIGNLTALDETRHEVKVAPEIDLITTPLEEQQDQKLVPVDQVLAGGSSNTAAIEQKSTDEEDEDIFDENELSESDASINHSILTAETTPIGSVFEEQKAVFLTDEPSIRIDLKPATPSEEEPKTASILTDGEEEDSSDPSESVADEDAETSDPDEEKPVAPVLIDPELPTDSLATSEPTVYEEEETASVLKEESASDPAVSDLIPLDKDVGNKLSTLRQLVQEAATIADGDQIVTHPESTNLRDTEEEEKAVSIEPFEELKPEIVKEETTPDIIEPANLEGVEEESPSGREEELSVEAVTSDVNEEEVSNPEDASSELLTPLHSDALATEVEHPESASSDIGKEDVKEPLAKEEQTTGSPFSSSLPTSDGSVLDESSNLDLFNLSMVCNSGEESGDIDDQLGLMDDSTINGLLNGPMVSQSDWKTVVGTNFSMIEKALGDIADDSLIVNCGEGDEEPDLIPEESGITVEAEVEGDSLEEPSSPTTPAGLEVSHQGYEQRSGLEDVKPEVTQSLQADLESRSGHHEQQDIAVDGECKIRDYELPMVTVSIKETIVNLADVATDIEEERNELDWALPFERLFTDEPVDSEEEEENQPIQTAKEGGEVEFDPDLKDQLLGFSG